jgi:hypothetical protein
MDQESIGYGTAKGTLETCSCYFGNCMVSIADDMSLRRTKLRASRAAWGRIAYSHPVSTFRRTLCPLSTRRPRYRSYNDISSPRGQFRRPKVAVSDSIRSEVAPDASRIHHGGATPHTSFDHASWIHQQRERCSTRQTTLRPSQGHRSNYLWAWVCDDMSC